MKKIILVFAIVAMVVSFVDFEPLDDTPYMMGDLDTDYCITQSDVSIAIDIAVGRIIPTYTQKILGDMNKDNRINSADVGLINNLIGICQPH